MSAKTGGPLQKEDRRGGVPDIGRELQLTPPNGPTSGGAPQETEPTWGAHAPARIVNPFLAASLGLLIAAITGIIGTGIWIAASRDGSHSDTNPATGEHSENPIANLPAEQIDAAIESAVRGYPDTLPAFVEKDSELGTQIRKFVPPGASQPLNLRLHWADQGRALLVTELIHNYWVDVNRLRKLSASR